LIKRLSQPELALKCVFECFVARIGQIVGGLTQAWIAGAKLRCFKAMRNIGLNKMFGFMTCVLAFTMALLAPRVHAEWRAGVAKVDITPDYPVRLSGYGNRTTEHEGVVTRLHVRALALSWARERTVVILTVDNCGVPASLRQQVVSALQPDGIKDDQLAVCSSHTHCAPMLSGTLPNLFGAALPAEQQQRVDRYTHELRDWMVLAARKALASLVPARLQRGVGKVTFAINRRTKGAEGFRNAPNFYGPKDHSLPVLQVTSPDGKQKIATLSSYACHCTTVSMNQIHSDWAGCASDDLEMRFPGMIALTAIGCGADQSPNPRRQDILPKLHGVTLSREVVRVINEPMTAVRGPVKLASKHLTLKYAPLPSQAELQSLRQSSNPAEKRHAQHLLDEIKSNGRLNDEQPYMVQAWNFSSDLSMVFLPGEVVVDYVLRLKREFKGESLWVNAYSNDVPCYISSERMLKEGGYEVDFSMVYYMKPSRLASGTEDRIIRAVHDVVDPVFRHRSKPASSTFAAPVKPP
jgi:neutral ceramidase